MKRCILFLLVVLMGVGMADAQEVKERLEKPADAIQPDEAPSEDHVWVPGEWHSNGAHYEWRDGYWTIPKENHTFQEGEWHRNPRTGWWVWSPGRWELMEREFGGTIEGNVDPNAEATAADEGPSLKFF